MGNLSSTIAPEAGFPVVMDRQQRLLSDGDKGMPLAIGLADEGVSFSRYRDRVLRTTFETVLADVLVQEAAAHALEELLRWRQPNEVAPHRPGQLAPNAQPGRVQALADCSGLQPQQFRDLWLAIAQEVEQDSYISLTP